MELRSFSSLLAICPIFFFCRLRTGIRVCREASIWPRSWLKRGTAGIAVRQYEIAILRKLLADADARQRLAGRRGRDLARQDAAGLQVEVHTGDSPAVTDTQRPAIAAALAQG